MKKTKLLFVMLIVASLVIFSCSDDSTGPSDEEEEIVLAENTTIMNETDLSEPEIDGNTYTYTYTGDPPEINEGDIIIGQLDTGYLRKVSSVEITDNEVILETEQACLTDAVENASINDSIHFTIGRGKFGPNTIPLYPDSLAKGVTIDRGTINLDNTTIFNGNVDGTELSVTITDGSASFEPTLNRELDISWFTLQHLLLSTEGNLQLDCDLSLICDNTVTHNEEVTVASFTSPPFMLGPVPMVLELDFDAGYETELDITGELTIGFDASCSVEYGAEYYDSQGWESIWNKINEFNQHPVGWDYTADCYAKGYIQPKLNLQIASVAGPYFGLEKYLQFDGLIVIPNWQWELAAGINGNLGFEVEILSFELDDYNTTLANWETTIATEDGGGSGDFEWCNVPAGDYTYGSPVQTLNINYDYEIMKYEVTNQQYVDYMQEALNAGDITVTSFTVKGYYEGDEYYSAGTYEFLDLYESEYRIEWDGSSFSVFPGYEDHPVVEVTWFGSWAFAEHYGLRLPTEHEWEKAARGNTGYDYPWGNDIDGSRANYNGSGDPFEGDVYGIDTTPVGMYNGQTILDFTTTDSPSPYGAYDMAGNVWNWTDSRWSDTCYDPVYRGGSWNHYLIYLPSWYRSFNVPYVGCAVIGFRCVRP